ncbi:hypothetical protein D5S18_10190 [Nocardia panacis]|uniref:ADP ribosyltransferase domain-containing protein n=1 Tax=Nocardia panacis TaxID=2340916 RepID=A0A3A4KMT2_9NOCA|nr:ADP-ribosyltransferase [Nocardia panacis]RJO76637.1 hypothetical protein D5S18_10190 [Nocardia panacis]
MTASLVIDVATYYDIAKKLNTAAGDFFACVDSYYPRLDEGGDMCGSYEEARKWAESYDARAKTLLLAVTNIAGATGNYAGLINQAGFNHATAEYNATTGAKGAAPTKPSLYPPVTTCRYPLPSAGGPGSGLQEALALVAKIGIIVPDGNAGKLSNIATTWHDIAADPRITAFPAALAAAIDQFDGSVRSPEVAFIGEDLAHLKTAVQDVIAGMSELGISAQHHREALDALRAALKKELEQLGEELLKELAINYAIGIALSTVTFGIGVAVASARAVQIAARFAKPIKTLIEEWKFEQGIAKGVVTEIDIAKNEREVRRIAELAEKAKTPTPKKPVDLEPVVHPEGIPKIDLAPADKTALADYTGGGAYDLNAGLRSGNLSVEQQVRADQLNATLDKLPDYQGMVTRRTTLPQDVLDRYKIGGVSTEKGFTSSSATAEAAMKGEREVEYQIVSVHGKYVGHYSNAPQELEVLFKSGTNFDVLNKFTDPKTGRIIIQMRES